MKNDKKEIWKKEIGNLLSKKFVVDSSGYQIYLVEHYYDLGYPPEFVDQFIKDHKSSGNIVGDIFNEDGTKRKVSVGVWNLDFLYGLVDLFNLDYPLVQGRMTNARECVRVLKEHFDKHNKKK